MQIIEPVTGLTILLAAIATVIGLFFDFTNGFNDSANQVATVIASNSVSPAKALTLAAAGNFIGAFFLGTAVAKTVGQGIVDPSFLGGGRTGVYVIIAALLGAIGWNLISWYFGIPSSSSHALIGGLVGSFLVAWGLQPIHWIKVLAIVAIMLISPIIGFAATYVFTKATRHISGWFTPRVSESFKRLQVASLAAQALSHGTNDAQKTMGVIAFTLVILGLETIPVGGEIQIPFWVIALCSLAIAAGTLIGGWRIIRTLGAGLYKVRPIHAFASQVASALIIYATAFFGYPISTTQVISSSVMGVGTAFRPKMVRWHVAQDMGFAWLVTIPASGVLAAVCLLAIKAVSGIV